MNLTENFRPFINALEKNIENQNWYGALMIAVTLPDICCSIDKTKPQKRSAKPYAEWFDKYIQDYKIEYQEKGKLKPTVNIMLNGKNAYALRCDVLHDGGADISDHRLDESLEYNKVQFIAPNPRLNKGKENFVISDFLTSLDKESNTLNLNIKEYCESILNGIYRWLEEYEFNLVANEKSDELIKVISYEKAFS